MECNVISEDIKKELDVRIQNLEEGKTELYSWDEIKGCLQKKIEKLNKQTTIICANS